MEVVKIVHQLVDPLVRSRNSLKEEAEDSTTEEYEEELNNEETCDHIPTGGYRSLQEVYAHCNLAALEPSTCFEAMKSENWKKTMEEELSMIEKNNTWILVERPTKNKILGVKWVFKTKLNADGSINKHKARLVVKGYAQEPGIDFFDTFAPVARLDTIKLLIAISAQSGWDVFQLDVKSVFLNGYLKEDIFIKQP